MAVKPKVLIGTPNKGDIKFETHMSLISVFLGATEYDVAHLGMASPAIDFNRNSICKWALENSVSHVCFVDTDMVFPSNTISQLLALEKPVVGVASRKKKFPRTYTIEIDEPTGTRHLKAEELPSQPFSTFNGHPIRVGTGVMLIDLEKVKGIPKPWFLMESYWNDEEIGYTGEDIYFCRKVWAAGLEVWCDPTINVGHIGDFTY